MADGDVIYRVRADNSGLEKDIKSAENMLISAADTVQSAIIGSAKALGTGVLAVTAGTAAIGTAAVGTSDTLDKAVAKIISATNASADSAQRLEGVVKEIYSDNFGESFDDIADSVSKVKQNLGELNDASLVNVTESAYALLDVFEMGVDESSRAARAMVQNFGISAEKAYDYIAAGAQNGLDYSGELLDSISEYSVQFAKMGLSADDMFNIFAAGAESGAWNLDKIGDAVKEMSIRVIDGSDSTKEGFEKAGLAADEMAAKFGEGGEAAREAFTETLRALISIENPLERDAAGVALLGTMWEDLGVDAVASLAGITDSAYDTTDAMESIKDVNYGSLSDALEGLKRQAEMLIEPLGESLIPLVEEVIGELSVIADDISPQLLAAAEPLITALLDMVDPLALLVTELLPPLIAIAANIVEDISAIALKHLPLLTNAIKNTLTFVMNIVEVAWECRDGIVTLAAAVGSFVAVMKIGNTVSAAVNAIKAFKAATDTATASQIAMNVAGAANPYVLIASLAASAIGAIVAYNNTTSDAVEKTKELCAEAENLNNTAKESKKAADDLSALTEEYRALKNTADDAKNVKAELEALQQELIDSYGSEATKIDLVNGEYKEQLELLGKLIEDKKSLSDTSIRSAYYTAKEAQNGEWTFQTVNGQNREQEVFLHELFAQEAGDKFGGVTSDFFAAFTDYSFKNGTSYEERYNVLSHVLEGMEHKYGESVDATLYAAVQAAQQEMYDAWQTYDEIAANYNALENPQTNAQATQNTGSYRIIDENGNVQYLDWWEYQEWKKHRPTNTSVTTADTNAVTTSDSSTTYTGSPSTTSYTPGNYSNGGYSSGGKGGNFVSITSYIPTIWDNDQTAELKSLIGADMVGNSMAAHSIDALTSGGISNASTADSGETGLADVVNAITRLQRKVESLDATVNVVLKADELTIGKAAVRDINSMAKQSGKSPFDFD